MSDVARPRGLGRGLSALLGESFTADFNKPVEAAPPPRPVDGPRPVEPTPFPSSYNPAPQQPAPPPIAVVPPAAQPVAPPPPETAGEALPRNIPIEHIQRNPNQPRKHFDEAELLELADSIRTHGVLQPILVRPISGQMGRYEIVAGERRWRAAQKAGVHALPAVIRELDEVEVLEIGIIENVQRADLNPLEEALGYQQLMDKFSRTQQDIADVVGKSRPHIANMLRLLNLPGEIQDMVRDGRLSAGHARAVLTAPDPLFLAREAVAKGLNVRDIEKLAGAAKDQRDRPARIPVEKDADTRMLEERMAQALGLPVVIAHKSEAAGGEVRISYKKLEQLDEIVRKLTN